MFYYLTTMAKAKAALKENQFTVNGKTYQYLTEGKLFIPGVGERTAAEVLVDEEAQKALVALESGFITEVIE